MIRTSCNDGWQVRPTVDPFAELSGHVVPYQEVTLPHDAMIDQERDASGGGAGGYFPGGVYEYRKAFPMPEEHRGRRIIVEFEDVYRDAAVFINGDYAGQRPYGYSRFFIDADRFLRYGQETRSASTPGPTRNRARCSTHTGTGTDRAGSWQGPAGRADQPQHAACVRDRRPYPYPTPR
ncbi:sugar-binding domain-containing protein [Streptosporangium vulgare]|uniref:Sugar-binding domain-containing protein n=1 Tax=Streptosporangium vulgare TaxID=46190 RepID=A0ABV5TIE8_9ACTN